MASIKTKLKFLGIIPARAGSKGVPGKNIRLLAGKPLIQYTIDNALKSEYLDTIMVSTDSPQILKFCSGFPRIETPFLRPMCLALDDTATVEVIQHALDYYEDAGKTFDFVCLLQPTSPSRKSDLIDETIQLLINKNADSLITTRKIPNEYNPHWAFYAKGGFLKIAAEEKYLIKRRQDLPDTWHRDGQVYLTSVGLIKEGRLLGEKLVGFLNDNGPHVNIDTTEDWEQAEKIMTNGFKH